MIDISKDSEIKSKLQETSKDEKNGLLDSAIAGSSSMSSSSSSIGKKFDLSKWTYSQLRDALNSSDTDFELLLACKEELQHRIRLHKESNEKMKNGKDGNNHEDQLSDYAYLPPGYAQINPALYAQRYFKIPFSNIKLEGIKNPAALKFNQSDPCSIWYAHFNGPYICRQMEIHPDAKPVLLITGRDDLKMCDLSLDATGLAKRKGIEIAEKEFDNLWQHYGGQLKQWTP